MSDTITVNNENSILSTDVFDAFLARHTELPAWLKSQKEASWKHYQELPMPHRKMESWRFANLKDLSLDPFSLAQPASGEIKAKAVEISQRHPETAGQLVFVNDDLAHEQAVSDELAQQGIVWEPLERAFAQHSEILEEFFMAQEKELGSEKFCALHTALMRNGTLLFVPANVEVKLPFMTHHWASGQGTTIFPHTLVIAKDNAKVTFVDIFNSCEKDTEQFAAGVSTLYAGNGARVEYHYVQNWNESSIGINNLTTVAHRDAHITGFGLNVGAKRSRTEGHTLIEGQGARAELYALSIAHQDQEIDQRTLQTHNAPNSYSDLLFKNALLDNAKTIFSGMIKVAEEAQQTDAYQTNRNLLLSPTAEANSLPGLEILANDVKCSHGATTGKLDEDELFYMLQRGIPKKVAQELMVFGFFEEILDKIENEDLANFLRELVQLKFKEAKH